MSQDAIRSWNAPPGVDSLARRAVVDEARSWLGTRYGHLGRTKGRFVDCVGLVIGIARALNLGDYHKRDYKKVPDPKKMERELMKNLDPIDPEDVQIGDILWFSVFGVPRHVGIVSDYPLGGFAVIHAYADIGKVTEHRLDATWQRMICGAFRFRGIE